MCICVMTEELTHERFQADQTFVNPCSEASNGDFDLERFRLLVDGIRPLLGACLENRIHSGLEEFVCNSSSRCFRRFPRVKRCLDAVADWLNYLDAFRAKDIEQEAIKRAIEYLLKDDQLTHFEDPPDPNTGADGVDSDSLTEQNAMKSRNVWNFIKEKDYWVRQDHAEAATSTANIPSSRMNPQLREYRKGSISSDLDVEVGSSSKEVQTNKRFFTNADNLRLLKPEVQYDHKSTSIPKQNILNDSKEILITVTEPKQKEIFISPAEIFPSTERNISEFIFIGPKSPKLKVVVHKAANTDSSTLWEPPKVTNVSIPCKSSDLIVRLFEANSSFSDSCLILMQRKFEHDIRNACSCMNDIFKKLDHSTIKRLCLNCQIRPGRIDLNLQRDDTAPKARLFLARVPTCLNVHKRESSYRNAASSTNQREKSQDSNSGIFDQCCASGEEFQEGQIAFYSQCSNHCLTEERRMSSKDVMAKDWGKELNFVWSRRQPREVDFVLSSCFTKSQTKKKNLRESCVQVEGKIHDNRELVYEEEETEGDEALSCRVEKNDTGVNSSITEEDDQRKVDHIICTCSLPSSGVKHATDQNESTVESCNPQQRFSHVSCANNDTPQLDNFEQKNFAKEETPLCAEKTISREACDSQPQNNVEQKNNILKTCGVTEESTLESKNSTPRVQNVSKLETNIVTVNSSILQIQETLITTQIKNISDTDESSRMKESYSADSICPSTKTSYNSKCSRCGEDLSEEDIEKVTNCTQLNISNLETHRTLNSISTKDVPVKERTKAFAISSNLQSPTVKSKTFIMISENYSRNCNNDDRDHKNEFTNENFESYKRNFNDDDRDHKNEFTNENFESYKRNYNDDDRDHKNEFTNENFESYKRNCNDDDRDHKNGFTNKDLESGDRNCNNDDHKNGFTNENFEPNKRNCNNDDRDHKNEFTNEDFELSKKNCNDCGCDPENGFTNEDFELYKRNCNDCGCGPENGFELCKCSNDLNSKFNGRINRKQFSCRSNSSMETDCISGKNCSPRNPERNVKSGSKFCRKPGCCSSSSKTRCKSKEDTSFRFLSRRRNSFWRGSIIPGTLCSSFPALDRIKYLIRKKLRRLLLEERDKGTCTSKTYLRNERYLVSISSGKLNEGRICSSIRCPFTTRNRIEARCPQKTFAEGCSLPKKENKRDTFEDCIRGRCGRMIRDNEVLRRIRLTEISKILGQKCGSKIDDRRKIGETDEGHPFHRDGKRKGRSSVASFSSTRLIFFEDDVDRFSNEKTKRNAYYGRCRDSKTGKLPKAIFREEIAPPNFLFRKNCRGFSRVSVDKDRRRRERGNALPHGRSTCFEKRLYKCCNTEDCDEDNDFMNLLCNYEKRISDLDADFRVKLLQYVALCRSVKDLLTKRLPRPDDV